MNLNGYYSLIFYNGRSEYFIYFYKGNNKRIDIRDQRVFIVVQRDWIWVIVDFMQEVILDKFIGVIDLDLLIKLCVLGIIFFKLLYM